MQPHCIRVVEGRHRHTHTEVTQNTRRSCIVLHLQHLACLPDSINLLFKHRVHGQRRLLSAPVDVPLHAGSDVEPLDVGQPQACT